jgi:anaerobic ribonucleoside-triphosphate reductase
MEGKKMTKEKNSFTLNERIEKLLVQQKVTEDQYDTWLREIKLLIERTTHPESFCPECDERTFFSSGFYECINCGWKDIKQVVIQETPKNIQQVRPRVDVEKVKKLASGVKVDEDTKVLNNSINKMDKNSSSNINWL